MFGKVGIATVKEMPVEFNPESNQKEKVTSMDTFKGKVRKILQNGQRIQVAKNHALCEIYNSIPGLKVGDRVLCNWQQTIAKLPENS